MFFFLNNSENIHPFAFCSEFLIIQNKLRFFSFCSELFQNKFNFLATFSEFLNNSEQLFRKIQFFSSCYPNLIKINKSCKV